MSPWSADVSPVGWHVGSYSLRFIERDEPGNDDPQGEFLVWENTAIVKADSLDEAYEKLVAVAMRNTAPYKGGPEEVPVQWVFEGVTELLPIFEELVDGAEIMWAEHEAVKLEDLRKRAWTLAGIKQRLAKRRSDD